MKLYFGQGACSLAPHIILQELGVPFETQEMNLGAGDSDKPEFLKINPMGSVPVLELDNGQHLTEGAVILQYLADLKPELQLAPRAGTLERYRLQEWLNFIATELHRGFTPLFAAEVMVKDPAAVEQVRAYAVHHLGKAFSVVAGKLGSRDFLMPSGYSVADAYLFVMMSWSRYLKVDMSPWPTLEALMKRVSERPAVQRAMKAERLLRH